MKKLTRGRRLWVAVVVLSLILPGLFGQKHPEEKHSGSVEVNAFDEKPLKYDGNYAHYQNDQDATLQQNHEFADSTASTQEQSAKSERIIKPSLGDFKPSPLVKFPETLSPPTSISSYGEIDTSAVNYGETVPHNSHPSPYSYYGKYQGSSGQQLREHYHHVPQLHPHPMMIYPQKHEGKHEPYREYDSVLSEERPYQHYLPPPPSYYQPGPPVIPQGTNSLLKDKFKGPWKTIVKALTALVPIGLFLAALPPNLITINSTATRTGKEGRSSAAEDGFLEEEEELLKEEYPVLNLMGRFGLSALDDPECDSRIFCEMSRLGEKSEGNMVQKFFWTVVNEAPDVLTEMIGLKKLFKAARTASCETYKCEEKDGKSR